jgi:peptide/nickel transport system substrate-binding protein
MKTLYLGAVLFLAALSLACAPRPSEPVPGQSDAETKVTGKVDESQCEPGKEVWRTPGAPKRGGQLVQAINAFDHLDLSAGGRPATTSHNVEIYNRLFQIRGCTVGDNVMIGSLVKSWETASDGKTWTLKLRDDVKWHNQPPVNGRKFTSADVGWSIEHQKKGIWAAFWDTVVSHEEPDASTVVLKLSDSDPELVLKMAYYVNVMLPHEIKEQYGDFKTVMVGTGAFQFKSYKVG